MDTCIYSVNSFNINDVDMGRKFGMGVEIVDYLWPYPKDEEKEKQGRVTGILDGFEKASFHGTCISRDVEAFCKMNHDELLNAYNESFDIAKSFGINNIIFHANYMPNFETEDVWLEKQIELWKKFLRDKPITTFVYIENFIDETPELLTRLYDGVADSRFSICLDTGHACCNADISIMEWIKVLGKRVRHVHLHNNDGEYDRHWPLGKGIMNMKEVLGCLLNCTCPETIVFECDFGESLEWLMKNEFLK